MCWMQEECQGKRDGYSATNSYVRSRSYDSRDRNTMGTYFGIADYMAGNLDKVIETIAEPNRIVSANAVNHLHCGTMTSGVAKIV